MTALDSNMTMKEALAEAVTSDSSVVAARAFEKQQQCFRPSRANRAAEYDAE